MYTVSKTRTISILPCISSYRSEEWYNLLNNRNLYRIYFPLPSDKYTLSENGTINKKNTDKYYDLDYCYCKFTDDYIKGRVIDITSVRHAEYYVRYKDNYKSYQKIVLSMVFLGSNTVHILTESSLFTAESIKSWLDYLQSNSDIRMSIDKESYVRSELNDSYHVTLYLTHYLGQLPSYTRMKYILKQSIYKFIRINSKCLTQDDYYSYTLE